MRFLEHSQLWSFKQFSHNLNNKISIKVRKPKKYLAKKKKKTKKCRIEEIIFCMQEIQKEIWKTVNVSFCRLFFIVI